MLTIEEIQTRLQDRNLSEVARRTELSYDTVWRVARGYYTRVSYDVVNRLSTYLTTTG